MYKSDLKHSNQTLEDKLHKLFTLNRHKAVDLSFRPPFLNLLKAFGEPQHHLPSVIHIAGTNGKGSTLAFMRAILEGAGKSVHLYTSPHLWRFNERIVLAGEEIEDAPLEALIDEALSLNEGGEVTFFEITTAMAMAAFSRTPADYCLLETGMGGRLDCTNIVDAPAVSVLSSVSLDHQEYLGETLADIAGEKAGIIKPRTPCILGAQEDMDSVFSIVKARTDDLDSPLYTYGRDWFVTPVDKGFIFEFGSVRIEYPAPALMGVHQIYNAGLAMAALCALNVTIGEDAYRLGLRNVSWPGRLEYIEKRGEAELWYDGGHNESAAGVLISQIRQWEAQDGKALHLVFGMNKDKDYLAFLRLLLPFCRSVSVVPIEGLGACVGTEDLKVLNADNKIYQAGSVREALAGYSDRPVRVLVCGSLYLAGQIR